MRLDIASTSPTTAPGSPAGPTQPGARTGPGGARGGSGANPRRSPSADRGGADRTPGSTPGGRWRASRSTAIHPRSSVEALNSVTGPDLAVLGVPRAARLRRPPRRPLADLLLPGARRAGPEPLRGGYLAVLAAPESIPGPSSAAPTPSWAPTTSPPSRRPRPSTSASSARSSRAEWHEKRGAVLGAGAGARALDRGRRLHAQHGPGPGRDDARGRAAGRRSLEDFDGSCSRAPRGSGRGDRPRPRPPPRLGSLRARLGRPNSICAILPRSCHLGKQSCLGPWRGSRSTSGCLSGGSSSCRSAPASPWRCSPSVSSPSSSRRSWSTASRSSRSPSRSSARARAACSRGSGSR